ncbi:SDR family oxidoreductase [Streptacidiphilus fuscans]|uniref:SDR family NAD(P)-dependent oxidoreductase n=1 Tax=Streptacidiphilus fuscans TaxID=2789292 RepID=A0A931B476_9ACTN|nr:SDR family oxidoreductase [Streptacidiphilus fuscans]MBF9066600.1 SDR family NAD(P)-dependent oxidoreductase [Streptacidiphilus fuscans]
MNAGPDVTTAAEAHPGIDPDRLQLVLDTLAELNELPIDHPQAIALRKATSGVYREVKHRRRQERRAAKTANDRMVTERTATGAADRIDDETQGLQLTSSATGAIAGILERPRACYTCKSRFVEVDAFYHQLCQDCARENRARRDARTDLTGKRALLTGGRAKIGMYIALRLLRDGAHTTITTRFPNDAIRRFKAMPDSADWLHRLNIVGLDLRDPSQVIALTDSVSAAGPLDILINNAAQTVRRSPRAYKELIDAEDAPLPAGELPAAVTLGRFDMSRQPMLPAQAGSPRRAELSAEALTALALTSGSAAPALIEAGTAIDAGGLVPDLDASNSWSQKVDEVDPIELLEVQLCNVTAPFILVSRLRPAMAASPARRKYVVNVSAMEGQFGRGYKGPGHPHTNMAKAALNMLTRTSAQEMLDSDGILMTAVDTGWITDERPHPDKMRMADVGFHAPLDLVDGAARVYDPIIRGEQGEDLFGIFLKDYHPHPW